MILIKKVFKIPINHIEELKQTFNQTYKKITSTKITEIRMKKK